MKNITTAFLLGAKVIEKHFTLNKKLIGNDHYHSMDMNDLKTLKSNLNEIKKLIGNKKGKTYLNSEKNSRKFARRSLTIKKSIKKGQKITRDDLICKRPGTGIQPIMLERVIGKKALKNLAEDHILKFKEIG